MVLRACSITRSTEARSAVQLSLEATTCSTTHMVSSTTRLTSAHRLVSTRPVSVSASQGARTGREPGPAAAQSKLSVPAIRPTELEKEDLFHRLAPSILGEEGVPAECIQITSEKKILKTPCNQLV